MEHDGRVYVYTTNDTQEWVDHVENGGESNNYGRINEINVWSSADLVNWTNHGPINAAGADGITRAAANRPGNSWAPAAAAKDVDGDGDDEFFLYFANSAGGIWVLQGESPLGPLHLAVEPVPDRLRHAGGERQLRPGGERRRLAVRPRRARRRRR